MRQGREAARRGAFEQAARHFERAVALNSSDHGAWNDLGVVLVEQGNMAKGIRALEQAINVDPTHAWAHRNLAIALDRQGRAREAARHYRLFLLLVGDAHPERDAVRDRLSVTIRQVRAELTGGFR